MERVMSLISESLMPAVLDWIPPHVIAWVSVLFLLASFLLYKMRHYADSEPVSEMELLATELQETVRDFADFSARVDTVCAEVDRGDREAYKRICGIQMEYIQIQSRLAQHDKEKQGMVKAYLQHCSKVKQQLQQVIAQHTSQGPKPAASRPRRPRSATTEPTRSTTHSQERRPSTFRPSVSFGATPTPDSAHNRHKSPESVKSLASKLLATPSKEKLRPGVSRKTNVSDTRDAAPELRPGVSRKTNVSDTRDPAPELRPGVSRKTNVSDTRDAAPELLSNRRTVTPPAVSSRSTSREKKSREGSATSRRSQHEKVITESKDHKDGTAGTPIHRVQIGTKNCQLSVSRGKDHGLSFTLEDERNGERSCIRFNAAVASEFVRQLCLDCDLLSQLQPTDVLALKKSDASIKSFTINSGAHRYYVDLKENQRGRFLCLSHRRHTCPVLTQLAIPAKHMVDLRDRLDLMLSQYAA